jgi:hypothetical protein
MDSEILASEVIVGRTIYCDMFYDFVHNTIPGY